MHKVTQGLTDAQRTLLGDSWSRAALAEHASIASFSRFSLHLLAVAAPASLIRDAHRAALDEIRHAEVCFTIASAYARRPLAPTPLPLQGDLLGSLNLAPITAAAIVEGCIGETIAALEAATAAKRAKFHTLQKHLQQISEDEARHAQLAWAFVRWALQHDDLAVHVAAQQAFDLAIVSSGAAPEPTPDDELLEAHGRLSARSRHACQQEGITEIIVPAANHLLRARA